MSDVVYYATTIFTHNYRLCLDPFQYEGGSIDLKPSPPKRDWLRYSSNGAPKDTYPLGQLLYKGNKVTKCSIPFRYHLDGHLIRTTLQRVDQDMILVQCVQDLMIRKGFCRSHQQSCFAMLFIVREAKLSTDPAIIFPNGLYGKSRGVTFNLPIPLIKEGGIIIRSLIWLIRPQSRQSPTSRVAGR